MCMYKYLTLDFFSFLYMYSHHSLSGDGQIDIDSDETVIAAEREMYEMRKAKKKHSGDGLPPTANFIGVQFTSAAKVERVYA